MRAKNGPVGLNGLNRVSSQRMMLSVQQLAASSILFHVQVETQSWGVWIDEVFLLLLGGIPWQERPALAFATDCRPSFRNIFFFTRDETSGAWLGHFETVVPPPCSFMTVIELYSIWISDD